MALHEMVTEVENGRESYLDPKSERFFKVDFGYFRQTERFKFKVTREALFFVEIEINNKTNNKLKKMRRFSIDSALDETRIKVEIRSIDRIVP